MWEAFRIIHFDTKWQTIRTEYAKYRRNYCVCYDKNAHEHTCRNVILFGRLVNKEYNYCDQLLQTRLRFTRINSRINKAY